MSPVANIELANGTMNGVNGVKVNLLDKEVQSYALPSPSYAPLSRPNYSPTDDTPQSTRPQSPDFLKFLLYNMSVVFAYILARILKS